MSFIYCTNLLLSYIKNVFTWLWRSSHLGIIYSFFLEFWFWYVKYSAMCCEHKSNHAQTMCKVQMKTLHKSGNVQWSCYLAITKFVAHTNNLCSYHCQICEILLLHVRHYRLPSKYVEIVKQVCAICADTSIKLLEVYKCIVILT